MTSKIKCGVCGICRWPVRILFPSVCSCFKDRCLWQIESPFILQIVIEKLCFHLLIVFIEVCAEIVATEFCPRRCGPASMCPWTQDEGVIVIRCLFFNGLIGPQSTKHVFCIKPATYHQYCWFNIF